MTNPVKVQRVVMVTTDFKKVSRSNQIYRILVSQGMIPVFFLSRVGIGTGLEYCLPLIGLAVTALYSISEGWPLFLNRLLAWGSGWTFGILVALLLSKPFQAMAS